MTTNGVKQFRNINLEITKLKEISKIMMKIKKISIKCMKKNINLGTCIPAEVIIVFLFQIIHHFSLYKCIFLVNIKTCLECQK